MIIADDDALVRAVLRQAIEMYGFESDDVGDGNALLAQVSLVPYDLCIMDVSMPGPSLEQRLTSLRHAAPHMALLVTSGYSVAPSCVVSGDVGYVTKPFTLATLTMALADLGLLDPAGG